MMQNVKIIAFTENKWIDHITDYRQWSNLCRSYDADFQLIDSWYEAIIPNGFSIVVLDEVGACSLSDFIHPENCVYILGRTGMNNLPTAFKCDFSVRVNAPYSKSMFGVSVGCAVLYDRLIKWQ